MTAPLLSTVDVPCPDCTGDVVGFEVGRSETGTLVPCPRCEGRGTVKVLHFTCPTCGGDGIDPESYVPATHLTPSEAEPCPDPNHDLHGPVTLARLEPVSTSHGERPYVRWFRIEAEWQTP